MYKILLCLRYLRTRYIALASIISVTLGVATMIVVNSVMAGFSTEMRTRLHGLLNDLVIETNSLDGQPDADEQMARAQKAAGEYIKGMTATVEVYGMMSFESYGQWITKPVTLIGIKPAEKAAVSPLTEYLESYQTVNDGDGEQPPERTLDTPPSWELSPSGRQRRELWAQREAWMLQQRFNAQASSEVDPAAHFGEAQADDAAEEPSITDQFQQAAAEEPQALPDAAALAKPNPAKVYVGHGLISWVSQDPETGATRTQRMLRPGEDVKISTVTATGRNRPRPEITSFTATVVDTFKSGMSEYDSSLVFCNIEELQDKRGMVDPTTGIGNVTSIQLQLKDYNDVEEVVRRLQAVFPPNVYTIRTWEQKQGPLLAAVEIESAILNVLLFLIIAVAGFGILAIFFMIVVEKTRDIGILKALGASSNGVMSIFLAYGLGLGIVGSGVGVVFGLLFVHYINTIEDWLTWLTGRKVFDETIYYFPEIPTSVSPLMVVSVALGAMAIAVLASILPARRASRLHPVEALRFS